MNSRPEAWLRQARDDLACAQLANANGFLAQSCYYASQAAEKALKGALLELGVEPPHTHVLNDLVQRLGEAGLDVTELRNLPLRSLSRMAIQSRYPLDATLELPQFRGQVDRSHAMTLRLFSDDQPDQDQAPVHGTAKAGGRRALPQ